MNIALLPSAFHPSLGGVEELTRQLAHALIAQGHRVILLTNRWPRALPAHEKFEGLDLYRLPFRTPGHSLRSICSYHLTTRAIRQQLCTILLRNQIDLLHVQCISANALYARIAAKTLGLPLVVSLQGELTMDADAIYQKSPFARRMYRTTLAAADALTACSAHTLNEAQEFFQKPFGLPPRSQVIHNGISLADFSTAPYIHTAPYMLAIGRHVPQKGFDTLLHAYALAMHSQTPPTQDLLLAGDGPSHADLRALAATLKIDSRVHFLGRTDRPTTAALFAGCDFFILPSRHEPQGIVNLEAMAAAKPVLATHVGGVPEIVLHNQTGLLVPPENPPALSAALQLLARDSALRHALGSAAHARAQRFTWPAVAAQYVTLYGALAPESVASSAISPTASHLHPTERRHTHRDLREHRERTKREHLNNPAH